MARFFRALLSVVLGLLVGSTVNMGLIMLSGKVIPPPADADVTTMEGLRASLHLFEAKHFVFPFLAHALGTVVGALVASLLRQASRSCLRMLSAGCFCWAASRMPSCSLRRSGSTPRICCWPTCPLLGWATRWLHARDLAAAAVPSQRLPFARGNAVPRRLMHSTAGWATAGG